MGRTPSSDKKDGQKRGPWTAEEDHKLIDYIHKHGCGNWRTLPTNAGLQRCGKSCRLRWTNYLRPDIKRGKFSFEEEQTIIQLHSILGNKWSAIAARLPGRTDNEIKNYWNTHIRKKLLRMGIDPVTHAPRLDLSSILNTPLINPSHIDFLRILGPQSLANPNLLRLATSLLSSQNHDIKTPFRNVESFVKVPFGKAESESVNTLQHTQMPPLVQDFPNANSCAPQGQLIHQQQQHNVDFGLLENCHWQGNGLPSNMTQDYYLPMQNYGCYEPVDHQPIMDPPPSIQQVWSTPSSSSTPLNSNSNSTQVKSSSCTTTEDEREISYCSDLFNFDVTNIFDVNEFM